MFSANANYGIVTIMHCEVASLKEKQIPQTIIFTLDSVNCKWFAIVIYRNLRSIKNSKALKLFVLHFIEILVMHLAYFDTFVLEYFLYTIYF